MDTCYEDDIYTIKVVGIDNGIRIETFKKGNLYRSIDLKYDDE